MQSSSLVRRLFSALLVGIIAPALAQTVITRDTVIGANEMSYDNTSVLVTNCTLTVDGAHSFASLELAGTSVLTHSSNSNGVLQSLTILTNEQVVLTGTNAVPLTNSNVVLSSILVSDSSGLYSNELDYYTVTDNATTAIARTETSAIPDGATVLVRYTFTVENAAGLNLLVRGDVLVGASARIDVNGRGYGPALGPGAGRTAGSPPSGGGAGFGGYGSASASNAPGGACYGLISQPTALGSGGGGSYAGPGAPGGGSIRIEAGGRLAIDGTITATGLSATNERAGGGSGGSIWLSAHQTLTGHGSIIADGGSGEPSMGGGGGGGRIALYFDTNSFTGIIQAHGGPGPLFGGAGTLYFRTNSASNAWVLVENGGKLSTNTYLAPTEPFALEAAKGGAVALSGGSLQSLHVRAGGVVNVITPAPITISSDVLIATGGSISANGLGSLTGPGAGGLSPFSPPNGGGGGYGGYGGLSISNAAPGRVYGSWLQPVDPGSGGGTAYRAGAAGGGVVRLDVGSLVQIDGTVSSDGRPGQLPGDGGGSGGSIWIDAETIAGSGLISASGGAGSVYGGGGGGGRIALYCRTNQFTGPVQAFGAGTGTLAGGPGSVYLKLGAEDRGSLSFDNQGQAGLSSLPLPIASDLVALALRNGARVGSSLALNLSSLEISSNAWLLVSNVPVIVTGDAVVDNGAGILADGLGYPYGAGPGAGHTFVTNISSTAYYTGTGAGHAGYGSASGLGGPGGNIYDTANVPSQQGSGGGTAPYPQSLGGSGGGVLVLSVSNKLTLNGRISADGQTGRGPNAGGGAGGSVRIYAPNFEGSGLVSANGGAGNGYGGGGGGGRIAIYAPSQSFGGAFTAYGGGLWTNIGGAGTIYLHYGSTSSPAVLLPSLTFDNGGRSGTNSDLSVQFQAGDIVIRGGAVGNLASGSRFSAQSLFVGSNSWLNVSGSSSYETFIQLNGDATIEAGGGIQVLGTLTTQGPGTGRTGYYVPVQTGGGGGFGGCGGSGAGTGATGGTAYGYAATQQNTYTGSSGASAGGTNYGGPGGGGIVLSVRDSLRLDGSISADGLPGVGQNSGGGSGGAVEVTASTFLGSGKISANGGRGPGLGGGGGGGRIYVTSWPLGSRFTNLFSGTLTAFGGPGYNPGGAGTIYIQSSNVVIADNNGVLGTNSILLDGGNFDLVIRNGALISVANQLPAGTLQNLLVGSNGWLQATRSLTINGDATIQAGGGIVADKLGYGPGQGPGAGHAYNSEFAGGGGHGGRGGGDLGTSGATYDSSDPPTMPGSGGYSFYSPSGPANGGSGGGIIWLTLPRGVLRIEGVLSARGGPGGSNSGGGAGGSIYITARALSGSGLVRADGGPADRATGGGGGGGRIAIELQTNLFSGRMTALGGVGKIAGGAGTVLVRTPGQNSAPVVIDNGGVQGVTTSLGSTGIPPDVTVQNGALLTITGPTLINNLALLSNGWLVFSNRASDRLTVYGDVTIASDSGITADGLGYGTGAGPGAGGTISSPSSYYGGGGGHGGLGGGPRGGLAYDSLIWPAQGGSGGGMGTGSYDSSYGGAGGGVISLHVTGLLQNNGRISADGTSAVSLTGGGGAGGTISLTASTFAGSGTISACGASGNGPAGGGAGGRIKIACDTNHFAGTLTASGGSGGTVGGAGTILLTPQAGPGGGRILVDNAGLSGTNTPLALDFPLDLSIGGGATVYPSLGFLVLSNLVVNDGGTITCLPAQTNIDIAVLGNALVETNGWITADGKAFYGQGVGRSTNNIGSGAGYGGNGGASSLLPGGGPYGSERLPLDRGSSGGAGFWTGAGGSEGGGAIRLNVAGTLTVNGSITADGKPGLEDDAGGGSGGSVLLLADTIQGAGSISANGGAGELFQGGGGSGGRIALYARTNSFAGQALALGAAGWAFGENGTLFTSATSDPPFILSSFPNGTVTSGVPILALQFNNPMLLDSVDVTFLELRTPSGILDPTNFSVSVSGATTLRFTLPLLSAVGDYTFIAKPGLATDLFGQPLSQSYTGAFTITMPVIQGVITDTNGQPVPGVLVQPSIGSPAITDSNGVYSIGAPPGATLTLTPSLDPLLFVPATRVYSSVSSSLTNQDFLAVASITPVVAAQPQGTNLVLNWTGIAGVTYQVYYSTDLISWLPLTNAFAGTNGPMQYALPIGDDPRHFYRLAASN